MIKTVLDNRIVSVGMTSVFKNVLYVLGAQFIILIISVVRSLLLPAFFDVESYGYWQIYLFYTAYVGLFAFGFNDGLYLRYGEYDYKMLPYNKLRTSIRIYSIMSLFISLISILLVLYFCENPNMRFSLVFAAGNIFILGLSGVFSYILQITNQLKRYSFFSILDKIVVIVSVLLMFVVNANNYKIIICVDFVSKIVVVLIMIYLCKELWLGSNCKLKTAIIEFKENISVGIKLLVANLMGMLIIGIGRFIIQVFGDIEDFASYSFGITITGLVLTAITAFSLVLYPTIKRLDVSNYGKYFNNINVFIVAFNFIALLSFFPAYLGVEIFYSKYGDLLSYMNLLFIVAILQGKMNILNNTFYKVLREEKAMMTANVGSVILFLIVAPILFYFTKSIWSIAFSTLVTMMFRCYSSELYLRKLMNIKFGINIVIEILIIILFILLTIFIDPKVGFAIYFIILVFWLHTSKSDLINLIKSLKNKM